MGLLANSGQPIHWDDPRRASANEYVVSHGIEQFLNLVKKYNDPSAEKKTFLWGEELEYMLVHLDPATKRVTLSLRGNDVQSELSNLEETDKCGKWLPEYGSFMLECTPLDPHNVNAAALARVQTLMQDRYRYVSEKIAGHNEMALSMTMFPLMGVGVFTTPPVDPKTLPKSNDISKSLFVPDACINGHPRFGTLTRNIRLRRGRKVCIQVPILLDERTAVDPILNIDQHPFNRHIEDDLAASRVRTEHGKRPREGDDAASSRPPSMQNFTEYFFPQYYQNVQGVRTRYDSMTDNRDAYHHPCVYMDCMAFGMGCCCLQVTMQLRDMEEARHLYDQLAVMCPMMLALTAATAVQKGILTDNDVRWVTVSSSVDDRVDEEVPRIVKSRYDSISTYIGQRVDLSKYNDCNMEINKRWLDRVMDAGIDERLARHVAHLFIREPLAVYDGKLESVDDDTMADHFENIQSTNWQTMRFKPPPPGSNIGWRVEFRVMEISFTAFENAAFTVFVMLMARSILKYNLNLYVPLSVVEMNMAQAHRRDAVTERRFQFRVNVEDSDDARCEALLVDDVINGTASGSFKGMAHYVSRFVDEMEAEEKPTTEAHKKEFQKIRNYVEFVRRKASGKLTSTASYIRRFVKRHASYAQDSKVTQDIAWDLVNLAKDMGEGKNIPEELVSPDLMM